MKNSIKIKERRINPTSHEIEAKLKDEKRRLKVNLKISPNEVAELKVISVPDRNEVLILVLGKNGGLFFVPIIESHDSAGVINM